jgi:DNA-binding NarL/FixJ family response regulator
MEGSAVKLLHVEDEDMIAALVSVAFSNLPDCQIVRVSSVSDALDKLRRNGFSCILLDFTLPDAKGLEALRKLRTHFGPIPIVGHSGDFDPALMPEAKALGLYDVIHKDSFIPSVIERSIRAAIAEHEVDRTNESHSRILSGLKKLQEDRPKDPKEGAPPP